MVWGELGGPRSMGKVVYDFGNWGFSVRWSMIHGSKGQVVHGIAAVRAQVAHGLVGSSGLWFGESLQLVQKMKIVKNPLLFLLQYTFSMH